MEESAVGVLTLIGIALATIAGMWWEFRKTMNETGPSWTARYTEDRMEDFALRYNPVWQEERRRQRAGLPAKPEPEQPVHREAA